MSKKTEPATSGPSGEVPLPNLKKRGIGGFITDVRREMKHVSWPTTKEATRLTGVVMVVCFGSVLMLWLLGEGFHFILEQLFRQA